MLVEIKNLNKTFSPGTGLFSNSKSGIIALQGVSFVINENESLGLVGESGCGKTTLSKIILGIVQPSSGSISFNPDKITNLRKDVQFVFQNPLSSLDPLMRIKDILAEPLFIHKVVPRKWLVQEMVRLLKAVQMDADALSRYPHEFSQGQRQRICIARAIASRPKLLILDEPLSALDLTIQRQIMRLLLDLRKEFSLSYLLISHNISHVILLCERVLVMYKGRIVEQGLREQIFRSPKDAYTQKLINLRSY